MINYRCLYSGIRSCDECEFRDPSIAPLVPRDVQFPVSIMFIGENPSWDSQKYPFDENTTGGEALDKYYLMPLGLNRDNVWITDLFKCRYPLEVYRNKNENKELIEGVISKCTQLWLTREIKLVRPKIIVTLSDKHVFQKFRQIYKLNLKSSFKEVAGKPHGMEISGYEFILFPMIHPDVTIPFTGSDLRKKAAREKWSGIHLNEHIPNLKALLNG